MKSSINTRPAARRGVPAALAVAAVAVSLVAFQSKDTPPAGAAVRAAVGQPTLANWNFERGDFSGWKSTQKGSGAWHIYADGTKPPNPADSDPQFPFGVPQPPEGTFAAVTDMSAPGTRILYRDVKPGRGASLSMTVFYVNVGPLASPPTLRFNTQQPNQQFRVDLVDPAAPVASMARKHILATVFRTAPGDPDKRAPMRVAIDLSRWENNKVRLRVAQVDNRGPLRAGVDDVRIQPASP